jgi:hypothetical protein
MKTIKINFFKFLMIVSLISAPVLTFAQNNQNQGGCPSSIESVAHIFDLAVCILRVSVWPLLISAAVIVFIVGVVKYINGGDDSTKREEGRNFIIYGIVGLFVIVSVWGLVGILQGTFGLGTTTFIPTLPQ